MNQASFLSLAHSKELKCERFLNEMDSAIPWGRYIKSLWPKYKKSVAVGRDKKDLELMLRIYFLQQWYNLGDPAVEEAIYDRISFQKFLGIDLLGQEVPDETTVLNFRHFLEEHNLTEELFKLTGEMLEERGYILKKGTIVDAAIIAAPSSTKNEAGLRDEEMKRGARKSGIYWGVLDKGKRGKNLSASQEKRNAKLSSIRAKVEYPFRILKCLWKFVKTRYKGLYKNACQIFTLFMLANIYMLRRKLVWV